MLRRLLMVALFLLPAYVGGYLGFRHHYAETRARDGKTYVIFPAAGPGRALYYLWRPMSYVDARITGVQAHIGPHRPA